MRGLGTRYLIARLCSPWFIVMIVYRGQACDKVLLSVSNLHQDWCTTKELELVETGCRTCSAVHSCLRRLTASS